MKSKKVVVILVVVILALMGGYLTYNYLNTKKAVIYIFNNNYDEGTPLSMDMLDTMEVNYEQLTQYRQITNGVYITPNNIDQVINSEQVNSLICDVVAGVPFTSQVASNVGGSTVEHRLSENMVATTIPVDNLSGVTPKIEPGSHINFYNANEDMSQVPYTENPLQDLKVLDVQFDTEGNLTGVTVESTPEQAIILNDRILHAEGKFRCSLIKVGEYEETAITIEVSKTDDVKEDAKKQESKKQKN